MSEGDVVLLAMGVLAALHLLVARRSGCQMKNIKPAWAVKPPPPPAPPEKVTAVVKVYVKTIPR